MIDVDAGTNGGISVKGWDRDEVRVISKIKVWADTSAEAKEIASQIEIILDGQIRAEGPQMRGKKSWSVSFEISVPQNSDLKLAAHNGGLSIADVSGEMNFETLNGGINLKNVSGDVNGATTNGGLSVDLAGNGWDGSGLKLRTVNGGINLNVADDYAADFSAKTTNGFIRSNLESFTVGSRKKSIRAAMNGGGAPIELVTTNGGVVVSD